MHPALKSHFPRLELLTALQRLWASRVRGIGSTVFVCVQHLMAETGSLFQSLIEIGAMPNRILVLGKPYSCDTATINKMKLMGIQVAPVAALRKPGHYTEAFSEAIQQLWVKAQQELNRNGAHSVVVLDDGGYCLRSIPDNIRSSWPILGIEQTTSGLEFRHEYVNVPVISVATSAAKRIIEPPIISRTVNAMLSQRVPTTKSMKRYGVVGLGNVGASLAFELCRKAKETYVYDHNEINQGKFLRNCPSALSSPTINNLVQKADVIFGCAGNDILPCPRTWDSLGRGTKYLVSCSSGDIEFQSLLRSGQGEPSKPLDVFGSLRFRFGHLELILLERGFPITFDRSPIAAPLLDIQVTRGLLLGAIVQGLLALEVNGLQKGLLMLDASKQKSIVETWLKLRPERLVDYSRDVLEGFRHQTWIEARSNWNHI